MFKKINLIVYLFIVISLIYFIFTIARILFSFQLMDFSFYYQSVQLVLNGGSPYKNGNFILNYPPTAIFFFFPFSIFTYKAGEIFWTLISVTTLLGSIFVLLKSVNKKVLILVYLLILSFAILSFPVRFNLGMGQVNLFILFFFCLSFYFYQSKRLYWAGIFLAIASAIKLTPILLLLFFIRKGALKVVVSTVIGFILLSFLGAITFGVNLTREYFFQVLPNIPSIGNDIYYNQALTGFLARLGIVNILALFINYSILVVLLLSNFFLTRPLKQPVLTELIQYGLFIVAVLIGGGLAWQHHFVLLIIPYTALFVSLIQKSSQKLSLFLSILSFILVALNIKEPQHFVSTSIFILSHVFYGNVLLYLLLVKQINYLNRQINNKNSHTRGVIRCDKF